MAATPKPLRKEIKKRVSSTKELYKSADAKKAGFHKNEVREMKKQDKSGIKKTVKKFGI
jgi:hypothetical protein